MRPTSPPSPHGRFTVEHRRTQYPVGHGFFHCGEVKVGGGRDARRFRYVYDCGRRRSAVPSAILEQARDYFGGEGPEAVFVSHLHDDHTNGFAQLLEGLSPKRVYLPYLTPLERLALFAELAVEGAPTQSARAMLASPHEWAARLNAQRVIEARPSAAPPNDELDEPFEGPDTNRQPDIAPERGNGRRVPARERRPGPHAPPATTTVFEEPASVVRVRTNGGSGSSIWKFVLYVKKADERLETLRAHVTTMFPEVGGRLDTDDAVVTLITNDANISALRDCYKRTFGSTRLNRTSLCLLSAPAFAGRWTALHRQEERQVNDRVGWLGTGDADLKSKKEIEAFVDHYSDFREVVHTLALPHHGSDQNFHARLVEDFLPTVAIATCDSSATKHPKASVQACVQANGTEFLKVTERENAMLRETFRYEGPAQTLGSFRLVLLENAGSFVLVPV